MALDAMIHSEDAAQTPPAAPKPDASKRTETQLRAHLHWQAYSTL
jgi:hypothetical protein